ncbi:MAG: MGMT family protein [Gemmatimonadota bacterium]|nr:MGMT family protein [Gemmatimonadota bacterium]MDH3479442.1 MGMT family protein [Gemmatimonadota bacterium]MDH3568817.1 MGMT family protein [Gemmatimonadota bacterium]MDH5550038.1 MGMT family protein [Gemmatimonadota bacterium]
MRRRKTFREKLADQKDLPRVERIPKGMTRQWGEGTMVIPAPREVDGIMRKVPKGKLITINQIREIVARRHGATLGCPITTGILARIAAGAAGEDEAEGKRRVTPYWRTLKTGGEVNPKYPGGLQDQRRRLEAEGHRVDMRGRRMVVRDYERYLVIPD